MGQAIRIQPYLSRDLFQKLRAYAAAYSQTLSSFVADALGEYLKPDKSDADLLGRSLDQSIRPIVDAGEDSFVMPLVAATLAGKASEMFPPELVLAFEHAATGLAAAHARSRTRAVAQIEGGSFR
jgi:hypothetical protein